MEFDKYSFLKIFHGFVKRKSTRYQVESVENESFAVSHVKLFAFWEAVLKETAAFNFYKSIATVESFCSIHRLQPTIYYILCTLVDREKLFD